MRSEKLKLEIRKMKKFMVLAICSMMTVLSFSQKKDSLKKVTTTGVFDTIASKSGYNINGYYVELIEADFKKYKGKRVIVTGKLLIIPGLDPNEKEISQGSESDRKFIVGPTIVIDKRKPKKR
jgi:hypothetical protein